MVHHAERHVDHWNMLADELQLGQCRYRTLHIYLQREQLRRACDHFGRVDSAIWPLLDDAAALVCPRAPKQQRVVRAVCARLVDCYIDATGWHAVEVRLHGGVVLTQQA